MRKLMSTWEQIVDEEGETVDVEVKTEFGAKVVARRRLLAKIAKRSRRGNYRKQALVRRHRQKIARRRAAR